jgi:uncharacterized protein YjbI with pentapeptide repeats
MSGELNKNDYRQLVKSSVGLLLGACLPFMQSNMNVITAVPAAHALNQQFKLPPIDYKDPNRCTLISSSIGQANAGRDKLYDVRGCDLRGQSAAGKDLSGIIAGDADFTGVNFKEGQISKAFARNSKFISCDFTNAILDRVSFDQSDMSKSVFTNAVLSGTTFDKSNLKDTDFTDAYLGPFDLRNLCANPSLNGKNPVTGVDTFESAGCELGGAKASFNER